MAVLSGGGPTLVLLEKPAGTNPFPDAAETRRYDRHWTPVHLDFHIADVDAAIERAKAQGATCEAIHRMPGRPPAAFMADPWGHGFCLIGSR